MKSTVAALLTVSILAAQASAVVWTFNDPFSGSQEAPPNASPGSGTINGTYDDVTNTISYNLSFTGMIGTTSAAHFHAAAVGVSGGVQIGPAGFPLGVTSGVYGNTHVLTAAQETQLLTNLWYFNIHTTTFGGGELRAQMFPIPTPGAAALLGVAGLLAARRRR